MPEKSILLGSSNRTHHEVWMIQDQVLCFQANPEININFMKELIINKAYEVGKLLDEQKNTALESIEELEPQLLRHFIMKCIASFLKMPNDYLIKIYEDRIKVLEAEKNKIKSLRIVKGPKIFSNLSDNSKLQEKISNGTSACAIDLVGVNSI